MKRIVYLTTALTCLLAMLVGCAAHSTTATSSASQAETTAETVADQEKGKRSNPYTFGEDIVIEVDISEGLTAKMIFNFSEAWDPERAKAEYPGHSIDGVSIFTGSLKVELSDPDSEVCISNNITPTLITENLSEEYSYLQRYQGRQIRHECFL